MSGTFFYHFIKIKSLTLCVISSDTGLVPSCHSLVRIVMLLQVAYHNASIVLSTKASAVSDPLGIFRPIIVKIRLI